MVVFVHNASMRPLKTDRVFVESGKKTFISVKRTFVSNSPYPYTDCQDLTSYSSPLYDHIKSSKQYSTYRQQDCFNLCVQEAIIENCNCSFSGFDNPYGENSTVRPCLTLNDYECYNKKFFEFDPTECASKSCPLECDSIEYDLSISSLIDPSYDFYLKNFGYDKFCCFYYWLCPNGGYIHSKCSCNSRCAASFNFTPISYNDFNRYFVKFSVFYPSLSFTQLKSTPSMTILDLLANLGGSMGFIVSVSFFTLFEIIELVVLMAHALFFKI